MRFNFPLISVKESRAPPRTRLLQQLRDFPLSTALQSRRIPITAVVIRVHHFLLEGVVQPQVWDGVEEG